MSPNENAPTKVWRDPRSLRVRGMGTALPGPPVPTDELLLRIEKEFGVPVARRGAALAHKLGIATRHVCRDFRARHEAPRNGHANADLAAAAVRGALDEAGLNADDLSYLIGHTTTPGRLVPPNISLVADHLGYAGPYMELRQACTGFANALVIAQGLLATPGAGSVAIVGSETGSVFFDPLRAGENIGQLVNLVQMGDGAAAIVLAADEGGHGARLSGTYFGQIGLDRQPGFSLVRGGSDAPTAGAGFEFEHRFAEVRSSGPELFVRGVEAARSLGTQIEEVERVLPHQANGRLRELLAPFLGIDEAQVFVNADRLGNTGSAAIWLALADVRSELAAGERALALGAEATKFMFGGFTYTHG